MDTGSQKENASEIESSKKHDSESDKDFIDQTLQKEKEIDPGNEHTHLHNENEIATIHNANAGGDDAENVGTKPE